MSLGTGSSLEIGNLCALVLEPGCYVKSANAVIRVKRGGTLIIRSGVHVDKGVRFVFENGSYVCMQEPTINPSSCLDGGAILGVNPAVQSIKNLYCGSQTKTMSAPPQQQTTYQSFFEGNPVYYQTWNMYDYKWEGGATIKGHGLEGDTTVNGLVYHKMNVGGTGTYHDMPEFWVRENERHDKVWVRLPWDAEGRDILVVDMNLKEGDLFPVITSPDTVYYEVDSVYYQEHDGGQLKHIRLKPTTDNAWTRALETVYDYASDYSYGYRGACDWHSRHLEFIEGVGSNLGFVYSRLGLAEQGDALWMPLKGRYESGVSDMLYLYDYIVCMERGDTSFYTHPNLDCVTCTDKYIWIEEVIFDEPPIQPANESIRSLSRYLRLSPNPAHDRVVLQWAAESPVEGACRIELYTLQGLQLRAFTTDSWPYALTVSDLPHGTYMLRVSPKDASAAWQATVRLVVL